MAVKNNKSDLGYLGEDFQFRLIHHFIENKDFFKDLNGVIDQNMFTNATLKLFVGLMKDYYKTYDTVPSYDILSIILSEKARSDADREVFSATLDKIKSESSEGSDKILELGMKFFRQQNIVRTANEILRIAGDGDMSKYESCVELLNDAVHQGIHEEKGVSAFEDLEETLSDDYRVPIPTGIQQIDKVLEGGLGKGELGLIGGGTSFGKTSLTTAMASFASTYECPANDGKGFKVLQIVFEDRLKQIQRKHIARIATLQSGMIIEARDLSKDEYKETVTKCITNYPKKEMLSKNLRIMRLPNGDTSSSTIRNLIKKLINEGFKPDMMIVDYFECLDTSADASSASSNEWEKEGRTMRRFESMASEFDLAIWMATQGTRDALNAEIVTMDKFGGSIKKSQIAHIIMSIARTIEDIEHNLATIAILKNRAGQSGKIFNNVSFNNGTCVIECNDEDSAIDIGTFNANKQKEYTTIAAEMLKKSQAKKGE